jgi:hypothetical protein
MHSRGIPHDVRSITKMPVQGIKERFSAESVKATHAPDMPFHVAFSQEIGEHSLFEHGSLSIGEPFCPAEKRHH